MAKQTLLKPRVLFLILIFCSCTYFSLFYWFQRIALAEAGSQHYLGLIQSKNMMLYQEQASKVSHGGELFELNKIINGSLGHYRDHELLYYEISLPFMENKERNQARLGPVDVYYRVEYEFGSVIEVLNFPLAVDMQTQPLLRTVLMEHGMESWAINW